MTAQTGVGDVIFINGPSLGGKTYFINSLMHYLMNIYPTKSISIISFESVYRKGVSYSKLVDEFKCKINSKRNEFDIVIAESTIVNYNEDALLLLLLPDEQEHERRFKEYYKSFGEFDTMRRMQFDTVAKARKHFVDIYTVECKNLVHVKDELDNNIKRCIREYVSSI